MFEIKNNRFYLNGEPFLLRSGAMHYFRIPREYWRDRLSKLKASGLNTVETYISWNLHEKKLGEYDFSGMLDVREFIRMAGELGLYVIVRPGPYICAEYDSGGFPAYLYRDKNIKLRCLDEKYLGCVKVWFERLFKEFADLQITKGGNIIAMQVENEYGSYGNDKEYIKALMNIMSDCGADCLLFTADGDRDYYVSGGGVDGVYKTLTFGSKASHAFDCLKGKNFGPNCCMEFWDGWFRHWGEEQQPYRKLDELMGEFNTFIDNDWGVNLYMFHGGTNFGFTAGANMTKNYEPTITSYDYRAPLTENGDYTPFYFALRKSIMEHDGISEETLPVPEAPKTQALGKVELTEFASLLDNLDNLSTEIKSTYPLSFAEMDMTNGYAYYTTEFEGTYTDIPRERREFWSPTALTLCNLNDLGYLYINSEYRGRFWRNDAKELHGMAMHEVNVGTLDGKMKIDLFVEAMGGVNYGPFLGEQKGLGALMMFQQYLSHWKCRALPMDNLDKLVYGGKAEVPCFLKGVFTANEKTDCYVKLDGFTKGFVTVNGRNLGRFWNIGPQFSLYLPGCWLNEGENEIVVFEQEGFEKPEIEIADVAAELL